MPIEYKRLRDFYQISSGIFADLATFYSDLPWPSEYTDALDLEYIGNHAGERIAAPILNKLATDGALTTEAHMQIAQIIHSMYIINWRKMYATMEFEYNPIENYSMTEKTTITGTVDYGKKNTRTDDTSQTSESDETRTPNLKQQNAVNGFNSTSEVESGSVTNTGTETNAGVYTSKQSGTVENAESGADTRSETSEHKRSGNIGVTTSQQMIEAERNLWLWHYFEDVVFKDIDNVLTLKIY